MKIESSSCLNFNIDNINYTEVAMNTINITTDAGFKNRGGSIGITFWSNNDSNSFDSASYVVQNVIFISNYEAELFGIYMGLLKLASLLEKKERRMTVEFPYFNSFRIDTVNIYCDNFTALSCSKVIHTLGSTANPLCMTREMIVNVAVNDFFHTMATFEKTPEVVLRTYEHDLHVRCICGKLFDVFNFLRPRITIGYMRHVHGHSISGDKDVKTFEKIFCSGRKMVMIPSDNRRSFIFPYFRTANTFAELYSNCITDAVASRRFSDLERFSIVCNENDDMEESDRRTIEHDHHLLVENRRECPYRHIGVVTADDIEHVNNLYVYPYLFDRIKQTFEKFLGIAEVEVMVEEEYVDAIKRFISRKTIYLKTGKKQIQQTQEKKTTKTKK